MRLLSFVTLFFTSTLMLHAQNFKVEVTTGTVADGQTLVVKPSSHAQLPSLSEAVIKKGKCVLKGKLPANDTICVELSVKDTYGYTNIVIAPGDELKASCQLEVSGKGRNDVPIYRIKDFKVENSPLTEKFQSILLDYNRLRDQFSQRRQKISKYSQAVLDEVAKANKENNLRRVGELYKTPDYRVYALADSVYYRDFTNQSQQLLLKHGDDCWGPMMMVRFYNFLTPKERVVFEKFSDQAKNSYHGQLAAAELYPGGQAGQMARPFTITDSQGKRISLEEFRKGKKYLLLDFWASWCVPCRREIPNVKKQYELYKNKGFEVVSVSIDKDANAWRKALEQEKLPWPNFLDNGEVAGIYNVKAIPAMFLMDANGKLIATGEDARGESLAKKLSELFK